MDTVAGTWRPNSRVILAPPSPTRISPPRWWPYGDKIAVGADLKDGKVAIKGWLETSQNTWETFFDQMQALGVRTMICTDISRDGAMEGTNRALYRTLAQRYSMDIIASGGVSSLEDIRALKAAGVAGAIIGKAYYTGAIDLAQAIALGKGEEL
ncbi:MAG: HisA/HisF-related TIM barrel protein [Evtepia sp.]